MLKGNAKNESTCRKVSVGAGYVSNYTKHLTYVSCNKSESFNCKDEGECYKQKVTGIYESCEETRKFCKAVHAEINLINLIKLVNPNIEDSKILSDGVVYCTRYPCENCAKELKKHGLKKLKYCGVQEISDNVKDILSDVDIEWFNNIDYEF